VELAFENLSRAVGRASIGRRDQALSRKGDRQRLAEFVRQHAERLVPFVRGPGEFPRGSMPDVGMRRARPVLPVQPGLEERAHGTGLLSRPKRACLSARHQKLRGFKPCFFEPWKIRKRVALRQGHSDRLENLSLLHGPAAQEHFEVHFASFASGGMLESIGKENSHGRA
jgi:hypothetical protein